MPAATYKARVVVLRKTKLGESDLILTMLAEDGSQLRAVAKGARKPQSPFSSRLELYSIADVMNAEGRNLDIVKEARLVEGNDALRGDMAKTSAASCMAELLERISQADLETPHLFDLTQVALASLCDADDAAVLYITAAHLLKALAFAGLRPSLDSCVLCSRTVDIDGERSVRFSFLEGGIVCDECMPATSSPCATVQADVLAWARALLLSTFADIVQMPGIPESRDAICEVLRLCQQWIGVHVGSNLKSLRLLLTLSDPQLG